MTRATFSRCALGTSCTCALFLVHLSLKNKQRGYSTSLSPENPRMENKHKVKRAAGGSPMWVKEPQNPDATALAHSWSSYTYQQKERLKRWSPRNRHKTFKTETAMRPRDEGGLRQWHYHPVARMATCLSARTEHLISWKAADEVGHSFFVRASFVGNLRVLCGPWQAGTTSPISCLLQ